MNDLDAPEYYVVPRAEAVHYASENHKRYMNTLGRNGQKHKDGSMRKFADGENKYRNKWELLGLD